MVRNHSFYATVDEIIRVVEGAGMDTGSDSTRIGVIGDSGTGKTTQVEALAHAIHKRSKLSWKVKKFTEAELLDFEATIAKLTPTNHILIFDDVSFLADMYGKRKVKPIEKAITQIRHLPGGKDVKIIIFLNYHYSKALPPYLRQADFRYFTSVGSSELKNFEEVVGSRKMSTIYEFQKMLIKAKIRGFYSFRIGPKEFFKYQRRDPWIMSLFFNGDSLRYIISPTRHWLDPICSVCSDGEESQIDEAKFIEESNEKWGASTFKTTIKHELRLRGIETFSPKYVQCRRYVDKALDMKIINIESIAVKLGLRVTNTRLRKKLDGVLLDAKE